MEKCFKNKLVFTILMPTNQYLVCSYVNVILSLKLKSMIFGAIKNPET